MARGGRDEGAKLLVEVSDFGEIGVAVGGNGGVFVRIEVGKGGGDGGGDFGGVLGACPDMFIVGWRVVVVGVGFHAGDVFFSERVDKVEHFENARARIEAAEDIVNPGVRFAADINKEVSVLNFGDIGRGGFISVAFGARGEEHRIIDIGIIFRNGAGKVVAWKNSRDDMKTFCGI